MFFFFYNERQYNSIVVIFSWKNISYFDESLYHVQKRIDSIFKQYSERYLKRLNDTFIYTFYKSVFVALVKINLILYATHQCPAPAATPRTIFFNYDHVLRIHTGVLQRTYADEGRAESFAKTIYTSVFNY